MRFSGAGLRTIATLMFVFSFLSLVQNAQAADELVWQFYESNAPANKGRTTARLSYGVPETDNVQVQGVCESRSGTGVNSASLTFGTDIGNLNENQNVKIRFSGDGTEYTLNGSIHGTKQEEGVVGVLLEIENSDPLWKALTSKTFLEYQIPGYRSSTLPLTAGLHQISRFIEVCRSYASALNAAPGSGNVAANKSANKAFDSAKELGSIEAWEAFLSNFPTGFRSDLARGYLNRLGAGSPGNSQQINVQIGTATRPSGPADISLSIIANQRTCRRNRRCSYTITATNIGGSPLNGPLVIANTMAPFGAELLPTASNSWFCDAMGGGSICSTDSTTLLPGRSSTLALTFMPPDNTNGTVNTCATISWGGEPTASRPLDVQIALARIGYNPGPADGRPGRKTAKAIRTYQRDSGLQETGQIDLPLLMSLFTQPARGDNNPDNDRACAQSDVSTPAMPNSGIVKFPTSNRQLVVKSCTRGRVRKSGKCVCPARATYWNGKRCTPKVRVKKRTPIKALRACRQGKIRLATGRCVCPAGTSLIAGQCISGQQLNTQIENLKNIFSDRRLKEDIRHVATRKDGVKLYAFRYTWEKTVRVGVMAQDLLADDSTRHTVTLDESGFYKVNYQALGLKMVTLKEWQAK